MRTPQQQRLYRIVWWGFLGESMTKLARDLLVLTATSKHPSVSFQTDSQKVR